MPGKSKYTFKKTLLISVWVLLGSGAVVLLVAAITKKNSEKITGVEIHISGVQNNYFTNKKEVIHILEKTNGGKLEKSTVSSLDLTLMEKELEKGKWIKEAEMFFDNNNVLQIKIKEREPIVRIFTTSGRSFYIDSSLKRLPLSDKFSARLPVFTSFPADLKVLKKQDSILLDEVEILSEYIGSHPFWMAQIDQVVITPLSEFELIPKLGNQVILFGNADNYREKFNKLLAFYKQVQTEVGWNRYAVLDIRFRNQVVGVKRNAAEIKSESLRSVRIMKNIIEEAKKNANDPTQIQLPQPADNGNDRINNSPVLEEVPDETTDENKTRKLKSMETKVSSVTPIHDPEKPFVKKERSTERKSVISRPSSNEKPNPTPVKKAAVKKAPVKKQVEESKKKAKRVPKAVMPPKSDY